MSQLSIQLGSLALLLAVACTQPSAAIELPSASEADPSAPPSAGPAAGKGPTTDVLACRAQVDDGGEVRLDGEATGVQVDADLHPRVRTFPWDRESVLIAIGMTTPAWFAAPEQIGTLYRVACERPREWTSLVHLDGADFAWAELSLDRRWLYFSYPGVGVLDFAAWDWAPLTTPRMIDRCWSAEQAIPAEDYVFGRIADTALLVYSGGPCGFEAEWEGQTQVIDGIREGEPSFRRKRDYVGTVAVDQAGRVWAGDGGQCSVPESFFSPGHPGLWRSSDAGESWAFVRIPALQGRGIEAVWIHANDPSSILARAECCHGFAADFCEGGELFLSEDDGVTWLEVSPRLAQSNPDVFGPVDQLEVDVQSWQLEVHVPSFESELLLRSRDGGRTWQRLPATEVVEPSSTPKVAELGRWHFEPGLEGLVRTALDEPITSPKVVFRPTD